MGIKITEEKYNNLKRSETYLFSDYYIFVFSGHKIAIYDNEMNELSIISGFSLTYSGWLSPDKKEFLAVSLSNMFYVITLSDFSVKKISIDLNDCFDGLEGQGCWSEDGEHVIIPLRSSKNHFTELRFYDIKDYSFTSKKFEHIYVNRIEFVPSEKKYLMFAWYFYGPYGNKCDDISDDVIIWFNDITSETYKLKDCGDIISGIKVLPSEKHICIYGYKSKIVFDYYGNRCYSKKTGINNINKITDFSVFSDLDPGKRKNIEAAYDNKDPLNQVNAIEFSINKKYCFIGTAKRLIIIDIETAEHATKSIDSGVWQIVETKNGHILAGTLFGIRIFDIAA